MAHNFRLSGPSSNIITLVLKTPEHRIAAYKIVKWQQVSTKDDLCVLRGL